MDMLLIAVMLLICVDVLAYWYGVDSRESVHEGASMLPPRPPGAASDEFLAEELRARRPRHGYRG